MKGIAVILLWLASAAFASPSVSSIVLKDAVALTAGAPVRLADVAALSGPDAAPLGDVVLANDAATLARSAGGGTVTLDQVRHALRDRRVNWGRVILRGSTCRVRVVEPASEPAPAPAHNPAPAAHAGPTIESHVARLLASVYGVLEQDLRLSFEDAEKSLLAQPIAGRRVEVIPEASAASPRMPVRIRMYQGETVVIDRSVRVDVLVRRAGVVAARPIRRGGAIGAEDVTVGEVWADPRVRCIVDASDVVGRTSLAKLAPGDPVTVDALKGEAVVKRNELITVRCLSGGLVLAGRARALEEGAVGDTIELRLEGGQKTFRGVIVSRGVAVVDIDNPNAPQQAGAQEAGQ